MKKAFISILLISLLPAYSYSQENGNEAQTDTKKLQEFTDHIKQCLDLENKISEEVSQTEQNKDKAFKRKIKFMKRDLRRCKSELAENVQAYAYDPDYSEKDKAIEIINTLQVLCTTMSVMAAKENDPKKTFSKSTKRIICNEILDASIEAYKGENCKKNPKPEACNRMDKISKNIKERS